MKIDSACRDTVRYVAQNMRQRDIEEFLALSPANDHAELVEILVEKFGEDEQAIVASGLQPVAVGKLVEHRRNVATLMFFATDEFTSIAISLTRFVRGLLKRAAAEGVHRVECVSIVGHHDAHRWIELLGLEQEAVCKGYGKNGEDYVQFSWVKS